MPEPVDLDPRALLFQTFERLKILPENEPHALTSNPISYVCWRETSTGDIDLVFARYGPGLGWVECSIDATTMARRVIDALKTPADVLNALVDMCEYWQSVIFTLLPITHQHVLKRAENMLIAKSPHYYQTGTGKGWNALFEMIQAAFVDSRATMERRLRAEPPTPQPTIKRRGGSDPRLPKDKRQTLHVEYDNLHKTTKDIKRDYNATLKAYGKQRGARGFFPKQWQAYWLAYSSQKYSDPELKDLLPLFADIENPSASEIAFTFLANLTGHKKSYVVQLVTDSRKAAKTLDNETND